MIADVITGIEQISLRAFAADYESYAAAIDSACRNGWTLNTLATASQEGRENVSEEYAAEVACNDIGRVYLTRIDMDRPVYTMHLEGCEPCPGDAALTPEELSGPCPWLNPEENALYNVLLSRSRA